MKRIFIFFVLGILAVLALSINPRLAHARYTYYGGGGQAWYPTRSFTGNYYGTGGLWGSYGGGYLYGPGNYGGWQWKSPTGRWWVNPGH